MLVDQITDRSTCCEIAQITHRSIGRYLTLNCPHLCPAAGFWGGPLLKTKLEAASSQLDVRAGPTALLMLPPPLADGSERLMPLKGTRKLRAGLGRSCRVSGGEGARVGEGEGARVSEGDGYRGYQGEGDTGDT